MNRILFFLITFFSAATLNSQERYLLLINNEGKQETIPIRKGETERDVLQRLDKGVEFTSPAGIRDSLINFGKNGATNFIASHQDVMFQWFEPQAYGIIKSFGWKNGADIGVVGKSTIRVWKADSRLKTLPIKAVSTSGTGIAGNMGYYKCANDSDGLKTPFKDEATDTNFVKGKGDSLTTFDPLGTEATLLSKGWQFDLVSNKWQGFNLLDYGDTVQFKAHELLGFTKQNDTKKGDIDSAAGDVNMLIGANTADQYPYHSFKFYEGTQASNYGWQIRDYEWNFYVIVEYTSPPRVRISFTRLWTTLDTTARKVCATVYSDNPPGYDSLYSIFLFYKISPATEFDTVKFVWSDSAKKYCAEIPGVPGGSIVTYYLMVTDRDGHSVVVPAVTYTIFKPTKRYLFLWNGRGTPGVIRKNYFMVKDSASEAAWYDTWDVKSYGTTDIPELLKNYQGVVEANGDGGYADLTAMAGTWLATGTVASPKAWFWSDQDHGFISNFADTTFYDTDPHAKYFGVKALINQDYANPFAAQTPFQIDFTGAADPVFGYLATAMAKDTLTMWYNPWYEWGFQNWVDEFTPTASAKVLFKDKKNNTKVIGLRNSAADNSWHTAWLAFDYASLELLKDTTGGLKGYNWVITDVGNPASRFVITPDSFVVVNPLLEAVPIEFSLFQNYPNPFNPTTTISYQIPISGTVTLKVFDVLGREIAVLVNEVKHAGTYDVQFNASKFSSGLYFYHLQSGNFVHAKKMLLLK